MPELPEVEMFRRHLESSALGRTIRATSVRDRRILRGASPSALARHVVGSRVTETGRRGKYAIAGSSAGGCLVFHFGMTRRFRSLEAGEDGPPYTRLALTFSDGTGLAYVAPRMLGGIWFAEDDEAFLHRRGIGPDALDVDRETFLSIVRRHGGRAKSFLMNQRAVAGVGNVYADEILFQARIHPLTRLFDIDDALRRKLVATARRVLRTSVERNSDWGRLPRSWLIPSRRKGAGCPSCGTGLERMKVDQRTSYFCPVCQIRLTGRGHRRVEG